MKSNPLFFAFRLISLFLVLAFSQARTNATSANGVHDLARTSTVVSGVDTATVTLEDFTITGTVAGSSSQIHQIIDDLSSPGAGDGSGLYTD
ncbi:MAG: hypothetical protein WC378_10670, partial [Opitutaceae bacterium]